MAKTSVEVVNGIKYYYKYIELSRNSQGKRVRKKIRAKTVKELNEKIEQFKNEQNLGISNQDERFGELFKVWLYDIHFIGKKASTKELYERLERLYITPGPLYGIKIKDLTHLKIQKWYNNAEISPYLLQAVATLVNIFLKYLFKSNYTIRDLSQLITIPKYCPQTEVQILTKLDQEKFVDACHENCSQKNFLLLALYTGARIGELESITWDDLKGNKLTINKTFRFVKNLTTNKYVPTVTPPKTKCSCRTLVLNNKAMDILKDQKKQHNLLKLKLGNKFPHPELIFTTRNGNFLEPQTIRNALNKVCTDANLPKIKFHALRHTFASRLIEGGVNIKIISNILGHSSTSVTEKVYIHVLEQFKEDTNELINQIL